MSRALFAWFALAAAAPVVHGAQPSVRVEFDGASYTFQHCVIRTETQLIEIREGGGGAVRRVPGQPKFFNVVCDRPLTKEKTFWEWRKQVEQGAVNRKKVTLVYLDNNRSELARFTVFQAWPIAAAVTKHDDTATEEIELAHDGVQRE